MTVAIVIRRLVSETKSQNWPLIHLSHFAQLTLAVSQGNLKKIFIHSPILSFSVCKFNHQLKAANFQWSAWQIGKKTKPMVKEKWEILEQVPQRLGDFFMSVKKEKLAYLRIDKTRVNKYS